MPCEAALSWLFGVTCAIRAMLLMLISGLCSISHSLAQRGGDTVDLCSNLCCRSAPTQDGVVGLMRIRHTLHKVVEEVGLPFGFPSLRLHVCSSILSTLSNRPKTLTRTL